MAAAIAATLAAGAIAWVRVPPVTDGIARLKLAAICLVPIGLTLAAAIGRIAAFRFTHRAAIDGGGDDRLRVPAAILSNTLEQAVLAAIAYPAAALLLPADGLGLVVAAAALFVAGRGLFWAGYGRGAAARAFGFAITFYPSVGLLIACAIAALSR